MDERICDLCQAVRAVVHCEADAAYLCLCCDAKVHNANTLVHRHSRRTILLCDSCSYTGCPSANEFAAFWGFKLDHISNTTTTSRISSSTNRSRRCGSPGVDITEVHTGIDLSVSLRRNSSRSQIEALPMTVVGSSTLTHHKISHQLGHLEFKNSIMDQIIDLNRLQLNQLTGQDQQISRISSSPRHTSNRVQHNLLQYHRSPNLGTIFQNQLWSGQNIQDLAVCEEFVFDDDFKVPNFGGDHHDQAAATILALPQLDDGDHKHVRLYPCSSSSSNSMDASVGAIDSTCTVSKKVQNHVGSLEYSPCRTRAIANAIMRYKAKKHSQRLEKKIRYPSRKATARARKRVQSRFVQAGHHGS